MKKWKTLSSKLAFDNRWFKVQHDVVELPNGKIVDDYFMWPEGDVVLIVALTKNKEMVLVKQYKHAVSEIIIEVPAGLLEKNESSESGARRELEEETGYTSHKFTYVTKLTNSPSKVIGDIHVYLAQDVEKTKQTHFDETENIEVLIKPYSEVIDMIVNGDIWVTGSISAIFLSLKKLHLI